MMEKVNLRRNKNINFLKGIACMGVVFIHIKFPGITGEIVSKIFQFATPIFFMIAGYYAFECNIDTIKRRLIKISKIFIWAILCFFVYNLILQIRNNDAILWIKNTFGYKEILKAIVFCTIDYAYPLWYLIAMIESYLVWIIVVKKSKENLLIKTLPILFMALIISDGYCETNNYQWFWKINFLTKSFSYFLMGYCIRERNQREKTNMHVKSGVITGSLGLIIALLPTLFNTKVDFSMIGLVMYSISVFYLTVGLPQKQTQGIIEYIGDKLSLYIYIFHVLIADIIEICCRKMFMINFNDNLFKWTLPIITLILTIIWAYGIERLKIVKESRKNKYA